MSLTDRLEALERDHADCERQLADPAVVADQRRYTELSRRYAELGPIVEGVRALRATAADLEAARELLTESTGDDREALRVEVAEAEQRLERLTEQLKVLLLPKDPYEGRPVIVEIRGAEGGEEANLFARDLFEMYRAFASRCGWRLEVLAASPSDLGGYSEVVFRLEGEAVWTRMRHEAGPHRVQRVPVTESAGRIHTSSATVVVLPEAEEVEVELDPNDLDVEVFRSSGPGGQSVNTTDSAVRITHRPTGIVVSMQDQKSQLQNRQKALAVLRSRLLKRESERHAADQAGAKRAQIGGGGRSEKIRTYNFKENRVSEHRLGLTLYQLERVLSGELEEISDALVADDRARRLAEAEGVAGG